MSCAREFSFLARIVREEEELKALRKVQMTQFAASEKRFAALDKRFVVLRWTQGLGFTLTIAFMGALKFLR